MSFQKRETPKTRILSGVHRPYAVLFSVNGQAAASRSSHISGLAAKTVKPQLKNYR